MSLSDMLLAWQKSDSFQVLGYLLRKEKFQLHSDHPQGKMKE